MLVGNEEVKHEVLKSVPVGNKDRFILINSRNYILSVSEQLNTSSELETVGVESVSQLVNRLLAYGEYNQFIRDKTLENLKEFTSQPLTDEDISILNCKHKDKADLDSYYNKLRVFMQRKINDYNSQILDNVAASDVSHAQSEAASATE